MSFPLVENSAEEIFEELYTRHVADVYRYALAVLRNPADAEDVTQTTFMNAYGAIKRGERPRLPQHWLIKIAHNACRTAAIRSARRVREVPLDDAVATIPLVEPERHDLAGVLAALGRLPFNQRAALVMRELEGRSYEQIAETLGVTISAVETLIFRARRSLRLNREALRSIAAVPLPASLAPLGAGAFGAGAAGTGGFAIGSGLALKAVAVAVALVAGGATVEMLGAGSSPGASAPGQGAAIARPAAQIALAAATVYAIPPGMRRVATTGGRRRSALPSPTVEAPGEPQAPANGANVPPATVAVPHAQPATAAVATSSVPSPTVQRSAAPVSTLAPVTVAAPSVPSLTATTPTVQSATVTTPTVPSVTVTTPTVPSVTVTTPSVPSVTLSSPSLPAVTVATPSVPSVTVATPTVPSVTVTTPGVSPGAVDPPTLTVPSLP